MVNFQMFKLDLETAEEPEIKLPTSVGSSKKQKSSRKASASTRASLVAQSVKNLPAVQETQFQSLGWEDPVEKEMATHSSILSWKISWTEEPGGLQFMGLQRVRDD